MYIYHNKCTSCICTFICNCIWYSVVLLFIVPCSQALNIFKYLIEHGDRHSLVIHVTVLDPLPDGPIFTDIKDKLHSLAAPDGLSMAEVL